MREGGGGKAWNLPSREHRPWPDLGVPGGGVLVAEGYWQECCRLVGAYQAWLDSGADPREQAREQVQ